jgi:hypothetical protein
MKSKTLLTICSALALMLLKSVPCWAQAEINPDHFDAASVEQVSRAGSVAPTSPAASTFQGRFTLLHEVTYAGLTLAPGTYCLTIRSGGSWDSITLIPKGATARIQARVETRSGAGRPAALILERDGQRRTLTGISMQPGMMLYLQGARSQTTSVDSELVPIFYVTRARASN